MKKAVIDLGTNTCNLLIAESEGDSFTVLYSGKEAVKLGKGGINHGSLTSEAMSRGVFALQSHKETIDTFEVTNVKAFGTSAIRGAANRDVFISLVQEKLEIPIEVIDGDREAELIYKGVCHGGSLPDSPFLILDIGGGSNEFIIATNKEILWKKSFNIGMARVLEKFQPSDPITEEEIKAMTFWYNSELTELWEACNAYDISLLIGCSGAFDTFLDLIHATPPGILQQQTSEISIDDFLKIHSRLLSTKASERIQMKGMDVMRVEMIVLASVFVNFIIERLNIRNILQSNASLKEGAMSEWFRQQ